MPPNNWANITYNNNNNNSNNNNNNNNNDMRVDREDFKILTGKLTRERDFYEGPGVDGRTLQNRS